METRGLVGMIEAADAMCKAAKVVFVGWQKADAGLVTGIVRGEVASGKAGTDARIALPCACCSGSCACRVAARLLRHWH